MLHLSQICKILVSQQLKNQVRHNIHKTNMKQHTKLFHLKSQ